MKSKLGAMLLSGLAGALLLLVGTQLSHAQITGTAHDLSARGWGSTQICVFCHTPHNATTGLSAPLWNHAVTASTFQTYSNTVSPTFNGSTTITQPGGVSKLCLSCHDGTVAIDAFGSRTGTTFMAGSRNLGTDLRNDHPISFTFNAALVTADAGGLVSPASSSQVVAGIPLFDSKLECATCHNVHSNTNTPFLRKSNAASALCLTCHLK